MTDRSETRSVTVGTVCGTAYGWVALAASERGVTVLTLPVASAAEAEARLQAEAGPGAVVRPGAVSPGSVAATLIERLARDIVDYYAGVPVDFGAYPLDLPGTPFIQTVRQLVRAITYGVTRSYGEVAALAGAPGAARAVGQVMAKNPVTVVIPCHRVVGASNRLQGFGGGLPMKERMLRMEGVPFAAPGRVADRQS